MCKLKTIANTACTVTTSPYYQCQGLRNLFCVWNFLFEFFKYLLYLNKPDYQGLTCVTGNNGPNCECYYNYYWDPTNLICSKYASSYYQLNYNLFPLK